MIDIRSFLLHHLVAYHSSAEECVRSGDFSHARFAYDPQVHLRDRPGERRSPALQAVVDKAGRALDEASAVCRSWSAAPPAIRDDLTEIARLHFRERLVPTLAACIDEATKVQ